MKKSLKTIPNSTVKTFKRKVGGIIFLRSVPEGVRFFKTLRAWLESNAPNNSIIYDSPEVLRYYDIPILDAIYRNGCYYKVDRLNPLKITTISVYPGLLTPALIERKIRETVNNEIRGSGTASAGNILRR